jgi:hypothetical protein
MEVARAALERVKEQFTGLASRTELIPEAGFSAAGGPRQRVYRLAEDADHR